MTPCLFLKSDVRKKSDIKFKNEGVAITKLGVGGFQVYNKLCKKKEVRLKSDGKHGRKFS